MAVGACRALLVDGHQCHFTVVVDQREARQHAGRQLCHGRNKAVVAALRRQLLHQRLQHLRIARMDGAHRVFTASAQRPHLLMACGVGQDGQMSVMVGAADGGLRGLVDGDACIHGHGTVFVHDDGVDVHLAQLGQLAGHFRNPQQYLLQGFDIGCTGAAPGAQRFGHARALDQAAGQKLVQRWQLHGLVVDQLDHGAARAKRDDRAERVVGHQADADFAPAPRRGHDSILSATGKPNWVAIIMASWALRARMVLVTGM